MKSKAEVQRAALIEALVEMDDKLMEKYFAGEEITVEELKVALRKGTIEGKLFPVLGGDSRTVMAKTILDYIALCLPSPLDLPPVQGDDPRTGSEIERKPDENEPFCGLVFKLVSDPHIGNLSYFRVYSGTLKAGSYVYNSTKGVRERVRDWC